jgi:hypothetical protein
MNDSNLDRRRPRALVVTGLQRTGTSAFRDVLGRVPDVTDCGEICTPLRGRQLADESFFTFLGRDGIASDGARPLSEGDSWRVVDRYLDYLGELHPGKTLLLDVKYDFLHNFGSASWLFTTRPFLLEFTLRRQLPVLHFTRANLLEVYCSLHYGLASGKWHYVEGETASASTRLNVDVADCLAWLRSAQTAVELVRGWLRDHPRVAEIGYDQLYSDDGVAHAELRLVERLLRTPLPAKATPSLVRTPVSYASVVDNLEEVHAHLRGTEFAWMAEAMR